MNKADSVALSEGLTGAGYDEAAGLEEADLLILNTCSVRQAAEDKVYGLSDKVSSIKKSGRLSRIILTGCLAGSALGERKRIGLEKLKIDLPWVDEFLPLAELKKEFPKEKKSVGSADKLPTQAEAFVSISEGCDNFCSYCVVPYARGPEHSRPLEEIIEEVKCLVAGGVREITLLGQNVNSYGKDHRIKSKLPPLRRVAVGGDKNPFARLLVELNEIEGLEKIKFLTSNPWDLTDDIIEAMKLPKIERYLHLPIQSGDDEVLRRMNRHYTVSEYKDLVAKIRRQIPDIRLGTDIIVGFPGETEGQFENTAQLCRAIKFNVVYAAKYSARPGTAAAKFLDDISAAEKKRRYARLMAVVKKFQG